MIKGKVKCFRCKDFLMIFCFILLALCIFADEISDKESELRRVNTQREELNRKAREADDKRRTAEQSKQQKQSQLTLQQRRVDEIIATNKNLRSSLENFEHLLTQTEQKLSDLQYSCNVTMLHLLLVDQLQTKLNQYHNDAYLLSTIMRRLIIENRKLNVQRISISADKNTKEQEVSKNESLSTSEQRRLNTITSDISKINQEIDTLEKQKAQYQAQANELDKAAQALQAVLNLLKENALKIQYTYEFTAGKVQPAIGQVIIPFGPKRHERYDISTNSNGVDIAIAENSPIRAMSDGTVVYADLLAGSGRVIIIDHNNGYHSVYSYINTLLVKKGDSVTTGQTIARSGKGPNSPEPSLHFEVRRNGTPINPAEVLRF